MIRSLEVVCRASVEAWPHAAAVALITFGTPGCAIDTSPARFALHLEFDTLAGELEAASLRVPQAALAVPFTSDHAHTVAAFLSGLQLERESICLRVRESEGYVRSATIARRAAKRMGCLLREPESAAAVASCVLMDSVLDRVPFPARKGSRWMPVLSGWAVQP